MHVVLNMWGEDHTLKFVKKKYPNGNLAIHVLSKDEELGTWEPWCFLTTNLPGFVHEENEAFLDPNNCSKAIIDWVFRNRYARRIGAREKRYCVFPLVQFSKKFMEDVLVSPEDLTRQDDSEAIN